MRTCAFAGAVASTTIRRARVSHQPPANRSIASKLIVYLSDFASHQRTDQLRVRVAGQRLRRRCERRLAQDTRPPCVSQGLPCARRGRPVIEVLIRTRA